MSNLGGEAKSHHLETELLLNQLVEYVELRVEKEYDCHRYQHKNDLDSLIEILQQEQYVLVGGENIPFEKELVAEEQQG